MRRFLIVLLASLAVTGCVTQWREARRERNLQQQCFAQTDTRAWSRLATPPANADAYRRMLGAKAPYHESSLGEFWYSLPGGEVNLCHTDPRQSFSCAGDYTEFTPSENGPIMGETQDWICVS